MTVTRTCSRCGQAKPIEQFMAKPYGPARYRRCVWCRIKYATLRMQRAHLDQIFLVVDGDERKLHRILQ